MAASSWPPATTGAACWGPSGSRSRVATWRASRSRRCRPELATSSFSIATFRMARNQTSPPTRAAFSTSPTTAPARAIIASAISPRSAATSRPTSNANPAETMSSASEPKDGASASPSVSAHGSWTHRLARVAVRPLLGTRVTPNHLTTARLLTGLLACGLFLPGNYTADIWGGVVWIVSAFLDRADRELARIGGMTTGWGHLYDYVCDTLVNALFFIAIGIGLDGGALGDYAVALGILAGGGIVVSNILSEAFERRLDPGMRIYNGGGGFDF